jgi:soluble lytic murein transglycosylase
MRILICVLLAVALSLGAVPRLVYGSYGAGQPQGMPQGQSAPKASALQAAPRTQTLSREFTSFAGVEARAESIAALGALVLVAQREGDFPSLLSSLSEKRRESRALQDELLALMEGMDPNLARRGGDLAAFLVEPPNLSQPTRVKETLRVVLPFIQTIPESLPTFGTFCLAAGLMLRENGQNALAGRYFEKASRTHFPLSGHALYLAVESAGATREADRLIELEKKLGESTAPDYLRKRARLVSGLALLDAGRDREGEEFLESVRKADIGARDRAKVATALGQLYEGRGEIERAARTYVQAFETGTSSDEAVAASRAYLRIVREGKISEDVPTALSAARCLVQAGLRSEAKTVVEKLFHAGKHRLEAGWELGKLNYRTKNYAEAARVFRRVEKLEKSAANSSEASLWVARCERQLSKADLAIELLRRAALVGRHVKYAEAAWELGIELESLGRLKEAAETYELLHQELAEARLGQEAMWRKGLCEYKLGAIAQAQSTFASFLKGKAEDGSHDMALFWMLKCSVERGSPVSSAGLGNEKARSDSLYGLLLENVLRTAGVRNPGGENGGSNPGSDTRLDRRVRKEFFRIPWIDWHLAPPDSTIPALVGSSRAYSAPSLDALRLPPSDVAKLELSEGLPPEAQTGVLLLGFGLRDLAVDELRACEKKFSGSSDALFLIAQLYWQKGLYRQALSLSDRLLRADQGLDETEKRFLWRILYPICYADVVLSESRAQAVDPFLVLAVMKNESTFDPGAVSSAGARGLMQLMPQTAGAIAAYLGEDTRGLDLRDPELNLRYGVWHLGRLIGKYSDSVVTALAAYNAGEDNAERWLASTGSTDGFLYMESVSFRETREYIRRVLRDFQVYREIYER